jgi:hypothetical protein
MPAKATSETAGTESKKTPVKRGPIKAVVTFDVLDAEGLSVGLPPGHRVVVRNVERDIVKFAERVLDNPGSIGMFAKIEVPFAA